jgi:hypothetical protein
MREKRIEIFGAQETAMREKRIEREELENTSWRRKYRSSNTANRDK